MSGPSRPVASPLLAALIALVACAPPPPQSSPPDLLLVTIDTLRADRVGAYGHQAARTPTFDALAANGLRFETVVAPMPRTTPALASLMTGLLPTGHGSREVGQEITGESRLLAELLANSGYETVGVSANGAAGTPQGLARGFARFDDARALDRSLASSVTDRALERMSETVADKPLFLWAHYVDPHFPYSPPARWLPRDEARSCRELMRWAWRGPLHSTQVLTDKGGRSEAARADCEQLYDAEIAFVDAEVGRLLRGIARSRPNRPMLVVVTSDHGENLGEDGLYYQHGPSLHDAGLLVPLVIHGPGIERRVDRRLARLQDLAPTLLSLVGVPRHDWPIFDGVDLLQRRTDTLASRLRGDARHVALIESGSALVAHSPRYISSGRARGWHCTHGPRFALCAGGDKPNGLFDRDADPDYQNDLSADYPDEVDALLRIRRRWPPEVPRARGIRTLRFKMIDYPRTRGGYVRRLFDLDHDPAESRDLSTERRRDAVRLAARLEEWLPMLERPAELELSDEEVATLRALGYLN